MSDCILVLAYLVERDKRPASRSRCSARRCLKVPRVIVGGLTGRRYYCDRHTERWAERHGYAVVDTV